MKGYSLKNTLVGRIQSTNERDKKGDEPILFTIQQHLSFNKTCINIFSFNILRNEQS